MSQPKKKPVPAFDEEEVDSEEEEDEETDDDNLVYEPEGLEEMATPTSRPSLDIPGSSASSMLPPLPQTPNTPTPSGRSQKKRKRDTISDIAKQLVKLQQTQSEAIAALQLQAQISKQQTDIALAQMRVETAKERMTNMEIHKSNQEWMREESKANRELYIQNREMLQLLMAKNNMESVAAVPAPVPAPVLEIKGQPSGSNISNASSPSQPEFIPPPLPADAPLPVPSQPAEDAVDHTSSSQDLSEERIQEQRLDLGAEEEIEILETGQNLVVGTSEVEPGSDDLPTKDQPAGSAR
jgi:hypothetical protein